MKIGIIGAGTVAQSIARSALQQGHVVILGTRRNPEDLRQLRDSLGVGAYISSVPEAASEDLVILAVPWNQISQALANLPAWEGRILVDATNPFAQVEPTLVLADLGARSASEIVSELAPGATVIKAFNSIRMTHYEAGSSASGGRRVLFVSGNDDQAKIKVSTLIESFGFAAVDLGDLANGGRLQQPGGPLAGHDLVLRD